HQQSWTAILKVIAFLFQGFYSFIGRTDAIYLIADVLCVFPGEGSLGPSWIQLLRPHHRDLPCVHGFRNIRSSGNLRTENDAAFCAGLRAAAALFVASTRRLQDHRLP